jgi:CheY-like chemotaxis protein
VAEENDSGKAHQTARNIQPDLILLDIAMPETDGGEVAAWIQSDPALHRIPIVFLTALVTTAEGRAGLRIQGHSFLAKPITIHELIKGIEENLPGAGLLNENAAFSLRRGTPASFLGSNGKSSERVVAAQRARP